MGRLRKQALLTARFYIAALQRPEKDVRTCLLRHRFSEEEIQVCIAHAAISGSAVDLAPVDDERGILLADHEEALHSWRVLLGEPFDSREVAVEVAKQIQTKMCNAHFAVFEASSPDDMSAPAH